MTHTTFYRAPDKTEFYMDFTDEFIKPDKDMSRNDAFEKEHPLEKTSREQGEEEYVVDLNKYYAYLPEQLKHILLLAKRPDDGSYFAQKALSWLYNLTKKDEEDPHFVLHCTDRVLETILFPLEFDSTKELTVRNLRTLKAILDHAEYLLSREAPWIRYVVHGVNAPYPDLAGAYQHILVYRSLYLIYTNSPEPLEDLIYEVMNVSSRNLKHIIFRENSEETLVDDYVPDDDFHYIGYDQIQPIFWIAKESCDIPPEFKPNVARLLRKYATFLKKLEKKTNNNGVFAYYHCLLDQIERLEESIELDDDDDEEYAAPEKTAGKLAARDGSLKGTFHESHHEFTEKLRCLMNEYPTMPVTVLATGMEDPDVAVSYVEHNGEPVEKVISIFSKKTNQGFDDEDELPFS